MTVVIFDFPLSLNITFSCTHLTKIKIEISRTVSMAVVLVYYNDLAFVMHPCNIMLIKVID